MGKVMPGLHPQHPSRCRGTERKARRNAEILYLRQTGKWTLQQIGDLYGLTRERVRQIVGATPKHGDTLPAPRAATHVDELAARYGVGVLVFRNRARKIGILLLRGRFRSERDVDRLLADLRATSSPHVREALGVPHEQIRLERVEQALARVQRGGDDECWLWPGAVSMHGYPVSQLFHYSRSTADTCVARMVWEREYGPMPAFKRVYRLCGERRCLNPRHMDIKMRPATRCKRGHAFTGEVYNWGGGAVQRCRECERLRERTRYAARKARERRNR